MCVTLTSLYTTVPSEEETKLTEQKENLFKILKREIRVTDIETFIGRTNRELFRKDKLLSRKKSRLLSVDK